MGIFYAKFNDLIPVRIYTENDKNGDFCDHGIKCKQWNLTCKNSYQY